MSVLPVAVNQLSVVALLAEIVALSYGQMNNELVPSTLKQVSSGIASYIKSSFVSFENVCGHPYIRKTHSCIRSGRGCCSAMSKLCSPCIIIEKHMTLAYNLQQACNEYRHKCRMSIVL